MSSGSAASERAVNPTRSTNSTETSFRSSRGRRADVSSVPQLAQKRASLAAGSPQAGQVELGTSGLSRTRPVSSRALGWRTGSEEVE